MMTRYYHIGATLLWLPIFFLGPILPVWAKPLTISISQEFDSMHPLTAHTAAAFYILGMTNRALVAYDDQSRLRPELAAEVPSFSNGLAYWEKKSPASAEKELVVIWKLNAQARWDDGTLVTCRDLAFTHQLATAPNTAVREREIFSAIRVIDWDPEQPKKCYFRYQKPRWDYQHLTWFRPLPAHLEEKIFKKYGHQKLGYEYHSLYESAPTQKGLYNGPYRLTEYVKGSHLVFVPNPHFYGKKPFFDQVIIKLLLNTATLEANLISKNIDVISSLGLSFEQALVLQKNLQQQKSPTHQVVFAPTRTYEHVEFRFDHPWLRSLELRQALIYGINRTELLEFLFPGQKHPVPHHFLPPFDPWYTDQAPLVTVYNYQRRRAQQLLDQIGWKVGSDGYRYRDGKKLTLELRSTSGNKTREVVQAFLKEQWKKIGVNVEMKNELARLFFGETLKQRHFEALTLYSWVTFPEESYRRRFACDQIPKKENQWSGQNYSGICLPKLDQLITQLESEFDAEKRTAIMHEMLGIYTKEALGIPLYFDLNVAVIPSELKGFKLPNQDLGETHHIEHWYLETNKKSGDKTSP